jgi:uncharacterized membrane protein
MIINTNNDNPRSIAQGWLSWLLLIVSLLIVGAFLFSPPWTMLGKTHLVGYAICHQIPERSFHIAGHQLPLCARCSGTFLGALVGFTVMTVRGRRRAGSLPSAFITVILVCFIGLMGIDGINSYLTLFPDMPHLYQPQNWLRLTTGILNGLALSAIVYPVFNYSLWRDATDTPSVKGFKELGLMLAISGIVVVLVVLQLPPLLYPLAILSTLGVMLMLAALNTVIVLAVTGREHYAATWQQAVLPMIVGLAVAFLEIGAIDVVRTVATRAAGLPF